MNKDRQQRMDIKGKREGRREECETDRNKHSLNHSQHFKNRKETSESFLEDPKYVQLM